LRLTFFQSMAFQSTAASHDSVAVLSDAGYILPKALRPVSALVAGATGTVSLTTRALVGYRWQNTGLCPAIAP
jgi:hypothetical protein